MLKNNTGHGILGSTSKGKAAARCTPGLSARVDHAAVPLSCHNDRDDEVAGGVRRTECRHPADAHFQHKGLELGDDEMQPFSRLQEQRRSCLGR